MTATRAKWTAAWLTAVAMTLLAPRGHAGLGDLDMGFGSNGQLEIDDPYDAQVMVQPDGKLLAVGNLRVARGIDRRYLVLSRWLANGQPDLGYGQGGRIAVPAPAWNEADIGAATLQPDGKIVIAGAGGVGAPATAANQWLRYVARIDANGRLDPGFGTDGIVSGGGTSAGIDGFGPGYTALRILANGDLLALIDEGGIRFIDRFAPDGRLVATTRISEGAIIDFVADSDTTAIVLSRRNDGGVLWRLLPNGDVDRSFGDQGYVEIRDTYPGALAADRGSRIVVCNSSWIQAYDLHGRVDKSFGAMGDGRVRFDDQPPQRGSGCLAVSMRAGGLKDFGAITIVAAEWGSHDGTTVVAQLDGTGRIDRDVGAGSGWQVIPVRPLPGDLRPMRALLYREADNPLGVWKVTDASGGSRLLVRALDMGVGSPLGTVGVMELDRPFNERQKAHVLTVVRSGRWTGAARVRFELLPGTAGPDDLELSTGVLQWQDGDGTAREIALTFRDDDLLEGEETFRLRLHDASGLDVSQEFTEFTIVDDDAVRALKFEQPSITWTTGPNIPTSAWPVWKLRLDEPVPGPVTAYYQLDDGWDWCCVALVRWAAGERGTRTVAPFPGQSLGPRYFVRLLDESADPLEQFASVTVIAEPTPTAPSPPPPTGGSPFNPTPRPASGNSGGGGAFDLAAAAALFALLLLRRAGRRHALR